MIWLLFLSVALNASQPQNQLQYADAVKTQVAALPTSTVTPTVTPLPANVNQGSTRRTSVYGNSVACGWACGGGCSEGWLPALIAAQSGIYVVGTTAVSNAVPILTPQAYTSAAGGERIATTISQISTYLPGQFPSPANTDIVLIGPALINDANDAKSQAYMTNAMYAAITRVAAINSLARIGVVSDPTWISLDNAAMTQASLDAYTTALGNGFRVFYLNVNSCINATNDRCNAGVDPHVSLLGNNKLGGCIAAQIPAP